MDMAPNLLREVSSIVKRILVGDYTYSDIKVLYINIRERARPGSITREIGDFVAHNERRKGLVFHRIKRYCESLSPVSQGLPAHLQVVDPYSEAEVVADLQATLLSIFPNHKAYLDRLPERQQGIFMCVLCILQGAVFVFGDERVTLSWGIGEKNNWAQMADIEVEFQGSVTTVAIIAFESTLELTEINQMQCGPFGCYERAGKVEVHMMW